MLECVPNVSEGRDTVLLDALGDACGGALLDLHRDADHHRSVFTLASPDASATTQAVRALATTVARSIDLAEHRGVHPRLGALDVVPFIDLEGGDAVSSGEAGTAARDFAHWVAEELSVPVFFYGAATAAMDGSKHLGATTVAATLPEIRRDAFTTRAPDLGPERPHPKLGAVAVGVRPVLIAVNVEAATEDIAIVRRVAASVRERDGGFPGVRALGLALGSKGTAQVSMNLVDLRATGLETACTTVRDRLAAQGVGVKRIELVGLLPRAEFDRTSDEFRRWSGISATDTIEARLSSR